MALAIVPIGQIFGKYEHQARIADLSKKTHVKTVQYQADRVTISPEARKAQVLGIARAVRDASKQLPPETKDLAAEKSVMPEVGELKDANLHDQARNVREKVMQKALEATKKLANEEANIKKEQYEKEATPF